MEEARKVEGKLVLHCGAFRAEEEEVRNVQTPEATETHFPVPHWVFCEQVFEAVETAGMQIDTVQYGLQSGGGLEGAKLFGVITTRTEYDDYALAIGFRNSHDKSMVAGLAAGSRVFVCDNLSFSSDIVVARRHTRYIFVHLPQLIGDAMAKVPGFARHQARCFEAYKEHQVLEIRADAAICNAVRQNVLPSSKVGQVIDAWDNDERFDAMTLWALFNAFTTVNQRRGLSNVMAPDIFNFFQREFWVEVGGMIGEAGHI